MKIKRDCVTLVVVVVRDWPERHNIGHYVFYGHECIAAQKGSNLEHMYSLYHGLVADSTETEWVEIKVDSLLLADGMYPCYWADKIANRIRTTH